MKNIIQVNENLILNYKDGHLCCVEKPLDKIKICIESNGDKCWFKNGLCHRGKDLPAIEYANGYYAWYKNGQFYRDNDLPALEYSDGTKYWYKNGQFHRDNIQ